MLIVIIIATLGVLALVFPNAMKFFVFAPILGFTFGGFFWCLAACITPMAVSTGTFAAFIFWATIIAEVVVFKMDL